MNPRLQAAMSKKKTYTGTFCKRCRTSIKWTSSGACLQCDKARSAAYYKRIRDLMKSD